MMNLSRYKIVRESIEHFKRGQDPKISLGIGEYGLFERWLEKRGAKKGDHYFIKDEFIFPDWEHIGWETGIHKIPKKFIHLLDLSSLFRLGIHSFESTHPLSGSIYTKPEFDALLKITKALKDGYIPKKSEAIKVAGSYTAGDIPDSLLLKILKLAYEKSLKKEIPIYYRIKLLKNLTQKQLNSIFK